MIDLHHPSRTNKSYFEVVTAIGLFLLSGSTAIAAPFNNSTSQPAPFVEFGIGYSPSISQRNMSDFYMVSNEQSQFVGSGAFGVTFAEFFDDRDVDLALVVQSATSSSVQFGFIGSDHTNTSGRHDAFSVFPRVAISGDLGPETQFRWRVSAGAGIAWQSYNVDVVGNPSTSGYGITPMARFSAGIDRALGKNMLLGVEAYLVWLDGINVENVGGLTSPLSDSWSAGLNAQLRYTFE